MCIYLKDDVLSLETQLISTAVESQITSTEVGQIPAYVYRLVYKPTGQYYYGYRKANIWYKRMPINDFWVHYFSSSTRVKAMIEKHGIADFDHEIIYESTDVESVYWLEQHLIKNNIDNPLVLNKRYVKDGQLMFVSTSESSNKGHQTRHVKKPTVKKTKATVHWVITSPTGETYETHNLSKFCRDNKLCNNAMHGVSKGITQHHKGWTCTGTRPPAKNGKKCKKPVARDANKMPWEVTNPEGEVMQIENLRHFCKENDLNYSSMRDVSYGRQQTHRGWKCVCLSKTHVKTKLKWEVIDPDGNLYSPEDLRLFCQEHGLHYHGMRDTAAGKQRTSYGWRCYSYEVEKPPVIWEISNPLGETVLVDDMK